MVITNATQMDYHTHKHTTRGIEENGQSGREGGEGREANNEQHNQQCRDDKYILDVTLIEFYHLYIVLVRVIINIYYIMYICIEDIGSHMRNQ